MLLGTCSPGSTGAWMELGLHSPWSWPSSFLLALENCRVVRPWLLSSFLSAWMACPLLFTVLFSAFFSVYSHGLPFPVRNQVWMYPFLWLQNSFLCLLSWHLSWILGLYFHRSDEISISDPTWVTWSSHLSYSIFWHFCANVIPCIQAPVSFDKLSMIYLDLYLL